MEDIILLLGGNLGDREGYLGRARHLLREHVGEITKKSSCYVSQAWGKTDQPDFINQVVCLKTSMTPVKLLECIWSIEEKLEREREERWGARTIDIDILFYGSETIDLPELVVPHKLLHKRRFALMPLIEIAPDLIHPIFKKTINQLMDELKDNLSVVKIEN
jgi:2-amino-4-hydroxy-6-hydroxymethyldihydropteridine diphosphokinase